MFNVPALNPVQPVNVAGNLLAAQQIKSSQMRNKLAEAAALRQEQTPALVQAAMGGDQNAMASLIGTNPQAASSLGNYQQNQMAMADKAEAKQLSRESEALYTAQQMPEEQQLQFLASTGLFDADDMEKLRDPGHRKVWTQFALTRELGPKGMMEQANTDRSFEAGRTDAANAQKLGWYNADTSRMNANKKQPGMSLTLPDGTVFTQGIAPGDMTPKTKGALESQALEATDGLSRLEEVGRTFEDEFQTTSGRARALWARTKDIAGFEPEGEEKAYLERFSQFKSAALDNINRYIKEITGAAMSQAEAERITRSLPNPGTGLFDGDSPTEFKAKYDQAVTTLKRAKARAIYARNNGITNPMEIPLDRMQEIVGLRGKQIEDEIKAVNPTIGQDELRRQVMDKLNKEFGR